MSAAGVVAYQGEPGAWGEIALRQRFGDDVEARSTTTFREVFEAVDSGAADAGVVPIENSLAGSIHENHDSLLEHEHLRIAGEVRLQVRHCLLARPGVQLADVRWCWSHPQALGQSMEFLRAHGIEGRAAINTAVAARDVAAGNDPHEAALASARAGELYGLEVLVDGVQGRDDNTTRFWVLERGAAGDQAGHVASLAWTMHNLPGALHRSLGVLVELGLDLTKLESRPTRGTPWEYHFYADVRRADGGPVNAVLLQQLRARLGVLIEWLRVLGVYDLEGGCPARGA